MTLPVDGRLCIAPKPIWFVLGIYAICGCIPFGMFWMSGDWQLPAATALLALAGFAFWYPSWQTALGGAVAFCWTPCLFVSVAAGTELITCEWGPEFLIWVAALFSATATTPAIIIAGTGAALFGRYASIGVPQGFCHNCCYDLRHLTHNRCPECGAATSI